MLPLRYDTKRTFFGGYRIGIRRRASCAIDRGGSGLTGALPASYVAGAEGMATLLA